MQSTQSSKRFGLAAQETSTSRCRAGGGRDGRGDLGGRGGRFGRCRRSLLSSLSWWYWWLLVSLL